MKKRLSLIFTLVIALLVTCSVAYAKENEWVFDEPQVLTQETKDYVENLNENVFVNYKNKPQLGIMIIDELPSGYTIDSYKLEKFNEYGVGTKKENCGLLFVFALSDRKYGLEIGDGFKEGSLLREELETDFITDDMKNLLRSQKYDAVVLEVVKHLENMMADEENGTYAKREQEQREIEELQRKEIQKFFDTLKYFLLIICPPLLIAFAIYKFGKKYLRKRKLNEFLDKNYKLISIIKVNREELLSYLMSETKNLKLKDIDSEISHYVYNYYIQCMHSILKKRKLENNIWDYKNYLKETNSYDNFCNLVVKDIDTIIYEVDQRIAREKEIKRKNYAAIEDFVKRNESRIENKDISISSLENKMRNHCKKGVLMSKSDLKQAFSEELHELNFKYEYEAFIKENKNNIDSRYFDSSEFYSLLRDSDEYSDNKRYCDHAWMLPLLFMHMEDRKNEIRREEERRAREDSKSPFNSSFGSGFGGGISSGGGFSGGW